MQMLTIGPFRYDPDDQCLWRAGERVELTPKTFAVLACLVEKAGRLVTKEELIEAVWPGVCVTDAVLKVRVAELRKRLAERAGEQRFIETLHRRGYRLVAPIGQVAEPDAIERHPGAIERNPGAAFRPAAPVPAGPASDGATRVNGAGEARRDGAVLFGREPCLERLSRQLERAAAGERRLVFVTGEPGAGKTTLLRAFGERLATRADVELATGQCIEHLGSQETFLPVLDALEKLCRSDRGAPTILRRCAPTWLAQLPWLLSDADRDPLAEDLLGATRSRMLREFGMFCERLSRERTVVLVLEDLHWCDHATVELLSWLASQQTSARLLVVVSLRPTELSVRGHPLGLLLQQVSLRDPSAEIVVEPLAASDIEQYLRRRLPTCAAPAAIAGWLHGRTGGNPLFVVNVVAYLDERGLLPDAVGAEAQHARLDAIADVVPDSLKRMIAAQIERLEPHHRELLLAGSIAGDVFCAGVLGAALEQGAESLDEDCRHLSASGQFIRHFDVCELPDGSRVDRYTFIHALYRDSLSQSLAARRRGEFHRRVGTHKARVYAGSTHQIASQLVVHFEGAGQPALAIRFLRESADNAVGRYDNRAAVCQLSGAIALLDRLPGEERIDLELVLLERRGLAYQAMADMESAVADFERLLESSRAARRVDAEVSALLRLSSALSWNDRERCLRAVDAARERSLHVVDEDLRASAQGACAYWNLLWRRWTRRDADDCERAADFARAAGHGARAGTLLARASYFRCLSSDYAGAAELADEGMAFALERGESAEYLLALYFRCWALLHAGRWDRLVDCLDEQAFRIADRNDHQLWHLLFGLLRAWLEEACGDADAAYRSAAGALAQAERHALPFGRLLGLVRLGSACHALGRDREALDTFTRCEAWLSEERVLMDWIVRMPLHLGLCRCRLLAGDVEGARSEARAALRLAEVPGERTYVALAHEALAAVAVATDDLPAAERALEQARRALRDVEAPMAAWRVEAASARLAERRGDARDAAGHWTRGARIIDGLAASLAARPALRGTFERSTDVRAVLAQARRSAPDAAGDAAAAPTALGA